MGLNSLCNYSILINMLYPIQRNILIYYVNLDYTNFFNFNNIYFFGTSSINVL